MVFYAPNMDTMKLWKYQSLLDTLTDVLAKTPLKYDFNHTDVYCIFI